MKNTLLLLIIFAYSFTFSQTHRFIYELEIHKKQDTVKVNMALDINKDFVKFYDCEYITQDSIRKTGQLLQYYSDSWQLMSRKRNSYENQMFFSHSYDYFVINSTDKMDWKLEKETKKFQNFTLHKATTDFGGRQWTAWFTTDFPFQEGPYKFRGLPGLILEIYDSEDIFHYTFSESKNLPKTFDTSDFLETHYGKKPISVSLKQYQKVKLDYYNNIIEDLNKFRENGGDIASEKDIKSKEDIINQKKNIQRSIRNYYLPIERDKAIIYPEN
ncbi:MAG: GLPGLI family protein [Bergeyella sp.]